MRLAPGVATALRKNAQYNAELKAVSKLSNMLATNPGQKIRATTKVSKMFLLQYPTIFAQGEMYSTHVKSVGAGVYEVFLKKT